MPRKRQNENSVLKKLAGSFRSSPDQGAGHSVALGMGDDAALFRPKPRHEIVLTCDWFLEGTHFWREKHPPDAVGWKCLARAVSDVAAMGGAPRCFLLSLALPGTRTGWWRHDTAKRDSHKCDGRGRSASRERRAAIRSASGRHPLCKWAAGGSGIGSVDHATKRRSDEQEEHADKKAPLSGAAACARPVVGQEGLGDRDDGSLRWTIERSATAVCCERGRCASGKGKDSAGAKP